jgi:UDP-2,4-diacetamido-2,4,6-trideoxy-beta-L-altropyranose hydrolase
MQIAFRTDASVQIGIGHVMRCLTLADGLLKHGAQCTFICRPHDGHLLDLIAQRGHQSVTLPRLTLATGQLPNDLAHSAWLGTDWQTDANDTIEALGNEQIDWLVVDHYAIDNRWEECLRPYCQKIMIIDDLADRKHDCDVLLDQNLGRKVEDYSSLLNQQTAIFTGPQYALLRPEFALLRSQSLARRGEPQFKRLLITMGGIDKDNITGQVLEALNACTLPSDLNITVVMGSNAPFLDAIVKNAAQMQCPVQVLVGVSNMAQLMSDSDLCIGAAGGTSWERCCLGLPTLLIVLAENQKSGAYALEQSGSALILRKLKDVQQILEDQGLITTMGYLKNMCQAAARVTDGKGAQRIISSMQTERLSA